MKKKFWGYVITAALMIAVFCPSVYGADQRMDAYNQALTTYGVGSVSGDMTLAEDGDVTVIEDEEVPLAGSIATDSGYTIYIIWTAVLAVAAICGDVIMSRKRVCTVLEDDRE